MRKQLLQETLILHREADFFKCINIEKTRKHLLKYYNKKIVDKSLKKWEKLQKDL